MKKRQLMPEFFMVLLIAAIIIVFAAIFGVACWIVCVIAGLFNIPTWVPFVAIYLLSAAVELLGDFADGKAGKNNV